MFVTTFRERLAAEDSLMDSSMTGSAGTQLDQIWRAAREAWPGVDLNVEAFFQHLAAHVADQTPLYPALARMCTTDLYLAAACAAGRVSALIAFERHCLSVVGDTLSKKGFDPFIVREVVQGLREQLLVAGARPPGIAKYRGDGQLGSWVRVMAVRDAVRLKRSGSRELSLGDDVLLESLVAQGDLELDHIKKQYREEFCAAFSEALAALPPRDKNILRQNLIDGLSIDQLAVIYRQHRATVARKLQRVRHAVAAGTLAGLTVRLRVSASELDSVLKLIRSQLDVTLGAIRKPRRERRVDGGGPG
jgi:RNA polymerase sigma-70 factor (ECF subfamily)